jgi:hypothetical protein
LVIVGGVLALLCGLLNSVAAALEKHEGSRVGHDVGGLRLLALLARRSRWLLAMALSAGAWVAEAAALALAPVPVVATARGAGRGVLVVIGPRWLGERFGRRELAGVGLATAGTIVVAASTVVGGTAVTRPSLAAVQLVAIGAGVAVAAAVVARARTGLAYGAAVGLLFAATGVFTKEIGDRVARDGLAGIPGIFASPALWIMIAFSVWAQSLLQAAFRQTNAANVAAINATVSAVGLVAAGYAFYHEAFPAGADGVALVVGVVVALAGVAILARARTSASITSPG